MKRPGTALTTAILILTATLAPTASAVAGEEDYDCDMEASACVRRMVEHIREKGWIGLEMRTSEGRPAIRRVLSGSPAEAAGFQVGDVLVAINDVAYSRDNEEALMAVKKKMAPGKAVTFTVERDGSELDIEVVPAEIPEHILAQWVGQHVMEHHMAEAEGSGSEEAEAGSGR